MKFQIFIIPRKILMQSLASTPASTKRNGKKIISYKLQNAKKWKNKIKSEWVKNKKLAYAWKSNTASLFGFVVGIQLQNLLLFLTHFASLCVSAQLSVEKGLGFIDRAGNELRGREKLYKGFWGYYSLFLNNLYYISVMFLFSYKLV
jgi:hypothetical protein